MEIQVQSIKNRVQGAYHLFDRNRKIKELEECLKLCNELLEKEQMEYESMSYLAQFWYCLNYNDEVEELKRLIEKCIIDEKLKPLW